MTAAEKLAEAHKRLDEALPPDLYGNSPEEYKAKRTGKSQAGSPAQQPRPRPVVQRRTRWSAQTASMSGTANNGFRLGVSDASLDTRLRDSATAGRCRVVAQDGNPAPAGI